MMMNLQTENTFNFGGLHGFTLLIVRTEFLRDTRTNAIKKPAALLHDGLLGRAKSRKKSVNCFVHMFNVRL